MRRRTLLLICVLGAIVLPMSSSWSQARRAGLVGEAGEFMSIAPDQVNMRAAPRAGSLIQWVYVRAGLPVLVTETYGNWRKVVDPDGISGWIRADMLSKQRTALVIAGTHALFAAPRPDAQQTHLIAPGNVGALSACKKTWCKMRIGTAEGWILRSHIWGIGPNEDLP